MLWARTALQEARVPNAQLRLGRAKELRFANHLEFILEHAALSSLICGPN